MHKEIEEIMREDKYYLDFLERFDRKKTKTFNKELSLKKKVRKEITKKKKRNRKSLIDYKPKDWGKGTENTSNEIDKILYG